VTTGWPVQLADGRVGLRPLKLRDANAWRDVRTKNAAWLRPWEATTPLAAAEPAPGFATMVRHLASEARAGRMLPLAVTYDGALAGQCTVGGITYGSLRAAHIGYWVDQRVAGRGVMPSAVAMTADHCFSALGLHRLEVNIRPENRASLRVVEKLGFRFEGERPRFLHIDGDWRDHVCYVMHAEDLPLGGLLSRWRRSRPHDP
jgi:ribosomal-protein-alanine N-acetyltransferase